MKQYDDFSMLLEDIAREQGRTKLGFLNPARDFIRSIRDGTLPEEMPAKLKELAETKSAHAELGAAARYIAQFERMRISELAALEAVPSLFAAYLGHKGKIVVNDLYAELLVEAKKLSAELGLEGKFKYAPGPYDAMAQANEVTRNAIILGALPRDYIEYFDMIDFLRVGLVNQRPILVMPTHDLKWQVENFVSLGEYKGAMFPVGKNEQKRDAFYLKPA